MKSSVSHQCPACSSEKSEFAFQSVAKSLSLEGYEYSRCLDCETIFLSSAISERRLIELHAQAWHEQGEFCLSPVSAEKRISDGLQLIDQIGTVLAGTNSSLRFLDVGSGEGHLCEAARRSGLESVGVEPSQLAYENAKAAYGDVRFIHGALEDLGKHESLIGRGFDIITFVTSLEHMFDPGKAVRCAKSLMKEKKGSLFIQVPNGDSLQFHFLQEHAYLAMAPYHRTLFSMRGLEALAKNCGFEIIKTFKSPFAWRWTQAIAERLQSFSEYKALRNDAFFREFDYQIDLLLDRISQEMQRPSVLSVLAARTDQEHGV